MSHHADTLAIRNGLQDLISRAPAGGVFHEAQTEPSYRNSFALRLEPTGPIYTVTITYGGAMHVPA